MRHPLKERSMSYIDKIKILEAKKQALEVKMQKLIESAEKEHIKHLRKLGLLDLPDAQIYGLVSLALEQKENNQQRDLWLKKGNEYLNKIKKRHKITEAVV